jgi:transcriptional regulator GlxA family with amidase domain
MPAARASYRRYLQLVGASHAGDKENSANAHPATPKRPLEPFFLKRADRFIAEHLHEPFAVSRLAWHCGVSLRTLEKAFIDFRGLTPVAHARNLRLDGAHRALGEGQTSVAEAAERYAFRSPTTFALEYRKRYGTAPSQTKRGVRA